MGLSRGYFSAALLGLPAMESAAFLGVETWGSRSRGLRRTRPLLRRLAAFLRIDLDLSGGCVALLDRASKLSLCMRATWNGMHHLAERLSV